jgi:hypothetical protein
MTSGRFEKADLDHNGLITQAEAGVYVAGNLFDGLDANHDRRVTSGEWNAGGNSMTAHNFHKADQNKDGVVTEEELKLAAIRSKQMSEFMSAADKNRDGGITKQEALAYYASKEGPM